MTTEATPTPKTTGELTLAELLTLLRETVAEALGGIVGYPDANLEPRPDLGAAAEPEAGADGSKAAHPATGSRVRIVDDEAAVAAKMARKVSDLSVDDLEWWVYYIVDEVGEELIGDPDAGLELSAWAQEQLAQADADRAAGTLKTIPLEEVARRLGLSE